MANLLILFGAEDGTRTRDPNLGKVMLYQLSHFRKYGRKSRTCRLCYMWSGRRDSNPRPQPWQGYALPTEPLPQKMEATTGIEPVIKALQASALPLGHVASQMRLLKRADD